MGKETPKFLFVGNHPCLDFINTQMMVNGEPTDVLESSDGLFLWLVHAGVLTKSQVDVARAALNHREMSVVLGQAKTFRTTMRDLAERIVAGKSIPDVFITAINQILAQGPGYPQLIRKGKGFEERFHSAAIPAQNVLVSLGEAASDLLRRTDFTLIKKCGNHGCILYFYDTSKNHTRNWCSMQICGNRMKVAAHYRRKRSQSEP
ncbi:MAG TPA: CGNR zinc finger domain-containing protein [Nitrospira sp.]|nr:CGNR zinc finger domain-containing protein [Nitrospira sp.]